MKKIILVLVLLLVCVCSLFAYASDAAISAVDQDMVSSQVYNSLQGLGFANQTDSDEEKEMLVEEVKLSVMEELNLGDSFTNNGFFFDLSAQVTLLRNRDFVPGGTIAFGYRNGISLYSIYGRFDYFLRPFGSSTGRIATIEFASEAGVSFRYVLASQDWQEVKLGIDLGYYMQWYEYSGTSSVFYLHNNGLMIRPIISVNANLYLFKIELGLYYQSAVYPRYSDYDGFGVYVKLF